MKFSIWDFWLRLPGHWVSHMNPSLYHMWYATRWSFVFQTHPAPQLQIGLVSCQQVYTHSNQPIHNGGQINPASECGGWDVSSGDWINTMAADALAPCVAKSSAAMVLTRFREPSTGLRHGHTAQLACKCMNHAYSFVVRACLSRIWPFSMIYVMKVEIRRWTR